MSFTELLYDIENTLDDKSIDDIQDASSFYLRGFTPNFTNDLLNDYKSTNIIGEDCYPDDEMNGDEINTHILYTIVWKALVAKNN